MIGLDGFECEGVVVLSKFKRDALHGGGGTMLNGENDAVVAVASEVEVGITPGVELGRATQGLTGTTGASALSGVVDKHDGNGVAPLQLAQEGEEWCDFTAGILIDAMKADKRIENEEARLQAGDGLIEGCAIGLEIEAQAGSGDHLNVELGETDAGGGTDAFEAAADDVERVLSGIEQDAAWPGHGEATQAGDTSGDGHGEIESEEGFAALGLATDDPDGFVRPQPINEPALLLGTIGEAPGGLDRKLGHRLRRIVALVSLGAGTAQVWKNSVSSI
jgi:hypothetical protein